MDEKAMTRTFYVDDEDSATIMLRMVKNADGLTNVAIKFQTHYRDPLNEEDKQERTALVARISKDLKVNYRLRELALFYVDDLDRVDEILVSNPTIEKLVVHSQNDAVNFKAIRRLLSRGSQVEIHFSTIKDFDATKFAKAIPTNSTLTSLTLSNCHLKGENVEAICQAIRRCSALFTLDLYGNSLKRDSARAIGAMLQENSTITKLVLRHTTLEGHLQPISDALQTNAVLKAIDLSWNGFKSRSGAHIEKILRENSTLTELCFTGDNISPPGIFDAIRGNTTLTKLEYEYHGGIEVEDLRESFAKVIQYNSTLTDISIGHIYYELHEEPTFEVQLQANQTLRVLDLSGSMMPYACVEAIGLALKSNTSLVSLMLAARFDDDSELDEFRKGLKVNCTLRSLWLDETEGNNELGLLDVGAIAIAKALAVNTGLEKVTMKGNRFSKGCLKRLATGLQQNTTLKELALHVPRLKEPHARILASGVVLSSSLRCLDLHLPERTGMICFADSLTSDSSLEDVKFGSTYYPQGSAQIAAFAKMLKVVTSLKRLWLYADLHVESLGNKALMEAYTDNAALDCEILDYDSSESEALPWFDYRLNRTGRLLWPDSTFPATLWSRALVLADLRSPPECPDILFHFIVTRPDIFKDCLGERRNKRPRRSRAVKTKR